MRENNETITPPGFVKHTWVEIYGCRQISGPDDEPFYEHYTLVDTLTNGELVEESRIERIKVEANCYFMEGPRETRVTKFFCTKSGTLP